MTSGVEDYDTDAYRHLQYSHAAVDFSPARFAQLCPRAAHVQAGRAGSATARPPLTGVLLVYPAPSPVSFAPAAIADTALRRAADCSIDFILLGLVAAHLDGAQHWSAWNQSAIVPASVRDVRFAIEGPCRKYTHPTHGFDRHDPTRTVDVSDISCLGGWSAEITRTSPSPGLALWVTLLMAKASTIRTP